MRFFKNGRFGGAAASGALALQLLLLPAMDAAADGPLPNCPDLVWGMLPPPGGSPFANQAELCANIPGKPLPVDLLPPLPPMSLDVRNAYTLQVKQGFLEPRLYANELGWASDAHWRLTGDIQGCPSDSTFTSFGVHLLVRVWYSPELVAWMCGDRTTELPVGAAIVKEEHEFEGAGSIIVDPVTHRAAPAQDGVPSVWAIMIKRPEGAWDRYYWGATSSFENGNPPLMDPAGLTVPVPTMLPAHTAPLYPTGSNQGSVVFPSLAYGSYCVNCHSVAASEQTFSTIDNILGHEMIFSWRGPGDTPLCNGNPIVGPPIDPGAGITKVAQSCPSPLPPAPRDVPDPAFLALYDEVGPTTEDQVWNGIDIAQGTTKPPDLKPLRYPGAQTWDRVFMPPPDKPQTFVTSDQCVGCHDGIANNGVLPYMVIDDGHGLLVNLSPGSEWRNASMGVAGRDPFFLARMEAEWNHVERDMAQTVGLGNVAAPTVADCVMDLCLSCHAKGGHFQKSMDTKGMGTNPLPGSVLQVQNTYICRDLLPPPLREGLQSKEDGHLFFVRPNLQDWPGTPNLTEAQARAANLGRDGVTCLACHLAGPDVGDPSDGFTANIPYKLDGKLFAPDPIGPPGEVMENAIGLLPVQGQQLRESRLCGACHAVNLPVLRSGDCTENPETSPFEGCVKSFEYEQTTYFEYLNSAYDPDSPSADPSVQQECQGCHMQNTHPSTGDEPLAFKVANIQDDSFYRYENSFPPDVLELPLRTNYRRHAFPGLNLFVNAFFQQFPLLLGYADLDWMNIAVKVPVLTQRDTLLQFARERTARIDLTSVRSTPEGLSAAVRVTNLAGHNLPSGVGFRRLFIEFSVLDDAGGVLWRSGRTDRLGQILGEDGMPLPTEHYPTTEYEPHHQVIRSQDEVQIYEEVVRDELGVVTTGFLHRWQVEKDNRIPPRGFRWDSMYVEPPYRVSPEGAALGDPDYTRADPSQPLDGTDTVLYEVPLSPEMATRAAKVRVRLLSQSVPPYFLSQIFAELATSKQDPNLLASQNQIDLDGSFLHFLASRFDASAVDGEGSAYLEDWKFEVARDQQSFGEKVTQPRVPGTPVLPRLP